MYVNSEMAFLQKIWLTRLVEIENKTASAGKRTVHCTKGENYTHLSLQRDMLGSPEQARLRLVPLAAHLFSPFPDLEYLPRTNCMVVPNAILTDFSTL